MAQYGVVLSGVTAAVLAYQKGCFDSFLTPYSINSQVFASSSVEFILSPISSDGGKYAN
jgi:hypothetical protein